MAIANPLDFYLFPHVPDTVFTAIVSAPSQASNDFTTVPYNTGVTGSFGEPLPGMTILIGSTSGGRERGVLRLREAQASVLQVNENDDVGPIIETNDFITIKNEFRLWPKFPRFVQSGSNITIFEDYDIAYDSQTRLYLPTAVPGPPGIAFLEGGQAQISFIGDRSFALGQSATITTYLWTAQGSVEGTSSSQGTEASPVIFTWTSPGWHRVSLKVTDSNLKSHTSYTWAAIENPDNPSISHADFDPISDSYDFEQGGGNCTFVVRGDISVSQFPEESMIVHGARGTQTTVTSSWPFRTNLLFSGWILSDTVRQNPEQGDVQFRTATIHTIMKNLSMFPVSLLDTANPVLWTEAALLDVDHAASFLWEWRSTLSLMTSIVRSEYTGLLRRQDFGPTDLYSQLDNELMRSIWGKVVSSSQGVLYHVIDYNIQNATERATATARKLLHKGIWINDVGIEEISNFDWQTNKVVMSGVFYPGGQVEDICPLFSEAPGDAPRAYGKETSFDRLILTSQTDLNIRASHALAKLDERFPVYRMEFINDGSFNIVPQDLFPANIEASDNDRGLIFNSSLIPRRITRTYNHIGGFYTSTVDFEPITTGTIGITVDLPCNPPEQKLPPAQTPAVPAAEPGFTSLMTATTGSSYYFAPGIETPWERRVLGLVDPDELAFEDLIADPWSAFKQGAGAEKTIVWACGKNFLIRSEDAGKNWGNRTSYLDTPDPPQWEGETNTLANTTMIRLQASIFTENQLFVLARWQHTGSAWHSAIAKSADGFTFVWHNLTGTSQIKSLGLSMDNGNGQSLYVTSWEAETAATGTVNLRQYQLSDMTLSANIDLGSATLAEVDAQTYFAHPFNRTTASEVFVFGRMQEPQLFTGSVHIMSNTDSGATGSWSVVENSWAAEVAGAFGADVDGNYYAIRQE